MDVDTDAMRVNNHLLTWDGMARLKGQTPSSRKEDYLIQTGVKSNDGVQMQVDDEGWKKDPRPQIKQKKKTDLQLARRDETDILQQAGTWCVAAPMICWMGPAEPTWVRDLLN